MFAVRVNQSPDIKIYTLKLLLLYKLFQYLSVYVNYMSKKAFVHSAFIHQNLNSCDHINGFVSYPGYKRSGGEPMLLHIERSQLRWLRHLCRMPPGRLPQEVFLACPTGRRPQGRPRRRWGDYVAPLAWERIGILPEETEEVSREREVWVCSDSYPATRPRISGRRWMDGWALLVCYFYLKPPSMLLAYNSIVVYNNEMASLFYCINSTIPPV